MLANGQPFQRRIALSLRAAGEHQQAIARDTGRLIGGDHEISRPRQATNLTGNGALGLQAAPEQTNLPPGALRDFAEQNQTLDVAREHRDHYARRSAPHQLFERKAHAALGARADGHIDIGAVAEQQ